jgi:kumamolisin
MAEHKFVPLPGSERRVTRGARRLRAADPEERVEITIVIRRENPLPAPTRGGPAVRRRHLSRSEFAARHGASTDDVERILAFSRQHGLTVADVNLPARTIKISGTVGQLSAAFRVTLDVYEHPYGLYRGRTGPVSVPDELEPIIEAVLGLDNRPQFKPHFVHHAAGALSAFTPPQVARMYHFPAFDGTGQTIGIIELGGGFKRSDLNTYFAGLGLSTPSIHSTLVDGAANSPDGDHNGPDAEVMLDIEVAGAVAPGAAIRVYFGPNSERGFLDAVSAAVHDEEHHPSVISISWGSSEKGATTQAMLAMDAVFADAAALGVTICVASGDDGSNDREDDGRAHADFPASSPFVLALGGTRLTSADAVTIDTETVWNANGSATGGGVSEVFAIPEWQIGVGVPPSVNPEHFVGRGLPDAAGNADPNTGYSVRVDGTDFPIGGTSAVAPLWAGLIASINQYLGFTIGFLNPLLYSDVSIQNTFRDIRHGNNGSYSATTGWDACTGWGTPDGARLLELLALWQFVQMEQ